MPSTVDHFSFRRMRQVGSQFGFLLDSATLTASSVAGGELVAANIQSFLGSGAGTWTRTTGDAHESYLWDRGAGELEPITWFHVAGVATNGTLQDPANPVTLTLVTGATLDGENRPVGGLEIELDHSNVTDDWFATFEENADRYVKLYIDGEGGGARGYFQIARATGDSFETFSTNFTVEFSHVSRNNTVRMKNAHNATAERFATPQDVLSLNWKYIGQDDADTELWDELTAYAGASRGPYAPEVPMWACPDPSGELVSLPPRFCTIDSDIPFSNADAGPVLYNAPLVLLQVSK